MLVHEDFSLNLTKKEVGFTQHLEPLHLLYVSYTIDGPIAMKILEVTVYTQAKVSLFINLRAKVSLYINITGKIVGF